MTRASFFVPGVPAPQGSKRAYVRGGRAVLVESSAAVKPWRAAVAWAAKAQGARFDAAVPLAVTADFFLTRPKSHYGTGRNANRLRDAAPAYPVGKPDGDKLLRSTLDGLTDGGVYRDDAQVVQVLGRKWWADADGPGALIVVSQLRESR